MCWLIKFIYMRCPLVQMDCEAMLEVRGEAEAELKDFTTSPVLRSNPLPSFSYKKAAANKFLPQSMAGL